MSLVVLLPHVLYDTSNLGINGSEVIRLKPKKNIAESVQGLYNKISLLSGNYMRYNCRFLYVFNFIRENGISSTEIIEKIYNNLIKQCDV